MLIFLGISLLRLPVSGQSQQLPPQFNAETEKKWNAWYQQLHEVGIRMHKDSLQVSDEAKRIMEDKAYRKAVYPDRYSWEETVMVLQKLELKKAFWFFTNLYETDSANRGLILQSILAYEKVVETDKLLITSFYTYAILDPSVSRITNGKIEILRPDVLDRKFAVMKGMISYIRAYREGRK